MKIHLYASRSHYALHLAGIWRALPPEVKGSVLTPGSTANTRSGEYVLVASMIDAEAVAPRPTIYVEHGAGQTYRFDSRYEVHGYSGSEGLDKVALFLCPGDHVAQRWQRTYPKAATAVIGAPWYLDDAKRDEAGWVGFSWHWNDHPKIPEMRSAWRHYLPGIGPVFDQLADDGIQVIGHGHPRTGTSFVRSYQRAGVFFEHDWIDVLRHLRCLVVDNSSIAYEAAALDIPVVFMNAPWYRKDFDHGQRFWNIVPGPQVDGPDEICDAIWEAIHDPHWTAERQRSTNMVYNGIVGRSLDIAVEAILAL